MRTKFIDFVLQQAEEKKNKSTIQKTERAAVRELGDNKNKIKRVAVHVG